MTTERQRFVELSINASAELLDQPGVAKYLSHDEISEAKSFLNRLFVPNIDSANSVTIPKPYRDKEAYPILALKPGEQLWAADVTPTPRQQARAGELFRAMRPLTLHPNELVDDLVMRFAKKPAIDLSIHPDESAVTKRPSIKPEPPDTFTNYPERRIRAIGKPYIIINANTKWERLPRASSIPHEDRHVEQAIRRAISPLSSNRRAQRISDELEAHQREAFVIKGARKRLSLLDNIQAYLAPEALEVEASRKKYNDPNDPYSAYNPELMEALDAKGLAQVVDPWFNSSRSA